MQWAKTQVKVESWGIKIGPKKKYELNDVWPLFSSRSHLVTPNLVALWISGKSPMTTGEKEKKEKEKEKRNALGVSFSVAKSPPGLPGYTSGQNEPFWRTSEQ